MSVVDGATHTQRDDVKSIPIPCLTGIRVSGRQGMGGFSTLAGLKTDEKKPIFSKL